MIWCVWCFIYRREYREIEGYGVGRGVEVG